MKIVAQQQKLLKHIQDADAYTDKSSGGEGMVHRRCVLIDVDPDDGIVTFTAESASNAIEFSVSEDIDGIEAGQVLVRTSDLITVLGTIQSDEKVTVEAIKGDRISIAGGRAYIELPVVPIKSGKVILPGAGVVPEETPWVVVKPEEFARGYRTAKFGIDVQRKFPILEGVLLDCGVSPGRARFFSTNKKVSIYDQVPVVSTSTDPLRVLLATDTVDRLLEYASRGSVLRVTAGSDDPSSGGQFMHHAEVLDDSDEVLYHVRFAGIAHDADKFPDNVLLDSITKMLGEVSMVLTMDKAEMLRLMTSAARVTALNPADSGGQARKIGVSIRDNTFQVNVLGDSTYEDSVPVKTWDSDSDLEFGFQWGLHGDVIQSHPGRDDINLAFLVAKGVPRAMVIYTSESGWAPGDEQALPSDYISLVPVIRG